MVAGAAQAQSIVGVLGIEREVAAIEARLQGSREVPVRGYVFRVGTLNGRQVVVGRSAAGKVNAAIVATVLIGHFNPSALFFSGTAGAIDSALRPGDVVIGTGVVQHDVGMVAAGGHPEARAQKQRDRRDGSADRPGAGGPVDRVPAGGGRVDLGADRVGRRQAGRRGSSKA